MKIKELLTIIGESDNTENLVKLLSVHPIGEKAVAGDIFYGILLSQLMNDEISISDLICELNQLRNLAEKP